MTKASVQRLTSQQPGAVAVLEVRGDINAISSTLGLQDLPVGGLQLRSLPDVPDVLIARAGASSMQFMPTGGPHIVERLLSQLISAGCDLQDTPIAPWPSSQEAIEQAMAIDLPNAASPLATELLLDQPRRWREFAGNWTADDDARSQRLCHLLHRPRIAVFGHANIGKSTLLNRLAGRERAKTQDASGTTRDYVSVELDLAGLPVTWLDTPGIQNTTDVAQQQSLAIAQKAIELASIRIAAGDAEAGWPPGHEDADLRIGLRWDLGEIPGADVSCAAAEGRGLQEVVQAVRRTLIHDADLASDRPWRWKKDLPVP